MKNWLQGIGVLVLAGIAIQQVASGQPVKSVKFLDFGVEFDSAQQPKPKQEELFSPEVQSKSNEVQATQGDDVDEKSWNFNCVSWNEVEYEVKSLYQESFGISYFPNIPSEFRNGCVFGHFGSNFLRVYITADNWTIDDTLVQEHSSSNMMKNMPEANFRDDLSENTIDWKKVILLQNTCSSTANLEYCLDKPAEEPWLDGENTSCVTPLCITIPKYSQEEILGVWPNK